MSEPRAMTCDDVRDLAPLFVTGALDPADDAAVREHLSTCVAAHEEVAELGGAALALLEAIEPAEPGAGLRTRILAAAAADLETGRHPAGTVTTPIAIHQAPARPSAAVASVRRSRRVGWSLAIAAAVAILLLGGLGLSLRRELDAAQAYQAAVNRALALAAAPGSQAGLIAADDGGVSGLGVIGADGTVLLAMRGLSATQGGEVYTAWAISDGGSPVPVGEFTVGPDGTAVAVGRAPTVGTGVVLALTLEPQAGATTPTLPIVAKGVTRPAAG